MTKSRFVAAFFLALFSAVGIRAASLPDLVVSGTPTASPNPATPGTTVHVVFTILNQGSASAGSTTTRVQIKRNSDNAIFADQDFFTSGVGAGQSLGENMSIPLSSSATSGSYTVYITLDRYSAITQSNISNDYGSCALSVTTPLPDILVSGSITGSPNPATAGGTVNVSFNIYNQGAATAGATTTRVQIKRNSDNATFADQDFATSSISAGQSISKTCSLTLSSSATGGSYTIYVILDRYSAITQSNTGNDISSGALTVSTALSDLVVSGAVSVNPNPAAPGATVHAVFTILNQGTASAGQTTTRVQIKRNSDNAIFGDQDFFTASVNAGQTLGEDMSLPLSVSATSGSYTVYITLDRYGAITQSNVANDYASGALTVAVAAPTISSISPTSGSTGGGDVVTILGTNLKSASSVTFGGVAATVAYSATTGNLQPTTPPHAAGTVSVSVTTPGGTATAPNAYTYVSSTGTLTGTVRDSITNNGISGASVSFNGASGTTSGSGVYTLSNVTCGTSTLSVSASGYQATSLSYAFGTCPGTSTKDVTLIPVPTISSVTPSSGSTAGGDVVTILGTNLKSASSVTFGGVAATVGYNTTTGNLQPTAPPHAAGTVNVTVTTPGGTATAVNAFTYVTPKTLVGIQVVSGPAQVNENSSAQYNCTATYSDGSTADVTNAATWSINTQYASIAAGLLTTGEVPSDQACQITVSYGGKTALANVTIKNVATPCTFTFNAYTFTLPAGGGSGTIQVTASAPTCTWTPTKAADGTWLTVSPTTQQSGNGTITFSAPANPSTVAQRGTTIAVGNASASVSQAPSIAPTCTYSLTPLTQTMPAAGGTLLFQLAASSQTCTWNAALTSGSWASISSGSSGTGNGTITVAAAANPSTSTSRTTVLSVGNATATITQAPSSASCTFTLSGTNFTLPAGGGSGTIQVMASAATCLWTPSLSNDGTWLTISPTIQQTGSGTITFTAPANPSTTIQRTATITVSTASASIVQPTAQTTAAPSITSFVATPDDIIAGGTSTLSWSVKGALTTSIAPFGNLPSTSSTTVSPSATTTYTLVASNTAGTVTANAVVRVDPALVIIVQGAPLSGSAPFDTALTANATGGVPPYSYRWSTGETGATASHRWLTAGEYDVFCTVTDAHGATRNSSSIRVNVASPSTTVALETFDGATQFANAPRSKAAADGATTLELRVTASAPATVTFRLSDGGVGTDRDGGLEPYRTSAALTNALTFHTKPTGDGHHAVSVTYQTPRDFNGATTSLAAERSIKFTAHLVLDSGVTQDAAPRTIGIVRPPLVFVHGLWSRADTWKNFPLINDSRFSRIINDWDGVSSIATAKVDLAGSIFSLFHAMRNQGIAVSRADIIAHSMGGLLARALYADGNDVVHKLITLNTPHYGSRWANILEPVIHDLGIAFIANKLGHPIDNGALTDLKVGSVALSSLGGTNLKGHAFVGYASLSEPCASGPGWAIGFFCTLPAVVAQDPALLEAWGVCVQQAPTVILGGPNDEIVSVTSQRGGAQPPAYDDVMGCTSAHTTVTSNEGTFGQGSTVQGTTYTDRVFALINTPVTDPVFDHLSEPPSPLQELALSTPSRSTMPQSSASLTVDTPKAGDVVSPGQPLRVAVSAPPDVTSVTLLTAQESIAVSGPPFEHTFTVPPNIAGDFAISAIARVGDTTYTAPPIDVTVIPSGTVAGLTITPVELFVPVGGQYSIKVSAYFSDGISRDVTQAGVVFGSTDPATVTINDQGRIIGLRSGAAIINVAYRGATGQVLVRVLAAPKRHAAGH